MKEGFCVLVVDPDVHDRELAALLLRRAAPAARVEGIGASEDFARALAVEESVDVVVIEHRLGWAEGVSLLETMQTRWPGVAVVVFTSTDETAVAVDWLKAGAADFLAKSSRGYLRLPDAVEAARGRSTRLGPDVPALRQRLETLERATRDLSEFPYIAAHELQAPLRAVSRQMERLNASRDRLDTAGQRTLDAAVSGLCGMQTLVDDLLTYSRIGTDGGALGRCDCNEIVDRAIAQVLTDADLPGATLTRGELPAVVGDPPQLFLLFRNLLANAVKFRAEKTPRVEVSVRASGDQWVFSVTDNGIGIAPASREAIFEMFTRLHPEYPGTGLGLAMARRVVERHHGRIWVESDAGQGATFSFAIPRSGDRRP